MAYRLGRAKAITATARKLAILICRSLKGNLTYNDSGAAAYDLKPPRATVRTLSRRAAALGFNLVNQQTGELLGEVS